ncbi:MAG: glycerol-3-phosphate 1-O-acyltransferase PlsY [Candidatus Methylacidiphilales bacterium]|nr:glycerol-3-phosphate 1-O-acyltransferase PlsY [Candidatus Methylacidiphilales bacterium]
MNAWLTLLGTGIASFLVGGIPFGYLAGRMRGIDLRVAGSGNIGATNAIRVLGKAWGIPVFLLDVLKAFVPLVLVQHWAGNHPDLYPLEAQVVLIIVAMGAVLGHNFCPYLGFKGGKGMATSAGVLLALLPWSCLACFIMFWIFFGLTRYVSVASIAASVTLPISAFLFYPHKGWFCAMALILGVMAVWRHRSNIQRLRNGTELRFGQKKETAEPAP